jgi:hypothetical protein
VVTIVAPAETHVAVGERDQPVLAMATRWV